MRNEYLYLSHKYSLRPINGKLWEPMGSGRTASLPVTLSWLANMYYQRKTSLQTMLGCKSAKAIHDLLRVSATPYWQMHNQFGQTIKKSERELTDERLNLIVINAVVPTLFAYGRVKAREDYCDLAFDLMEQCKAERNEITKYWEQLGVRSMSAGDSQSLTRIADVRFFNPLIFFAFIFLLRNLYPHRFFHLVGYGTDADLLAYLPDLLCRLSGTLYVYGVAL